MLRELDRWLVQSSARVGLDGERLSSADVDQADWYAASLPATVLAVLVQHGVYADPFVGRNFLELPGRGPAHQNFSNHPMPDDSPFKVPWWFLTSFAHGASTGRHHWLELDGLNYRATLYLNGRRLRDQEQWAGAYRSFELLLDEHLQEGQNRVALAVSAPREDDLAITWVDWNPSPPDKNMGLWRGARVRSTGPVRLCHPQVLSRLPGSDLALAELSVFVTLENARHEAVDATLEIAFEGATVSLTTQLGPRERRELILDRSAFAALQVQHPRLWWPRGRGAQPLYELALTVRVAGVVSDARRVQHGIREVTSELTDEEHSLFRVNRQPILIRGGGWARDMLLRSNAQRELYEYEYVKDLNLNTIRFEGMVEGAEFLERCDRDGMLVIAGFCCCDHWEKWQAWKPEDLVIAEESLRSELRRLRNHPSLIAWWYGSDFPPPRHVEERYLAVLGEERWPNPAHSSAAAKSTELTGPSGMKMAGPYDYVPPSYWLMDRERGGAFGFASEISPGPAIPPESTLRAMLGEAHLWPPDECWTLHSGGGPFKDRDSFDRALAGRYGPPRDVSDYVWKAQLANYEAERAMFEAYRRRKYRATGVIQWMLNNAWPSLIWHLWDHALRAAGAYYGVKKACEALHIQYDAGLCSISVVSELSEEARELSTRVRVLDLAARELFRHEAKLSVSADAAVEVCQLPESASFGRTSLLLLELTDPSGRLRSRNVYWLSSEPDVIDWPNANWYTAPLTGHADFHALAALAPATLRLSLIELGRDEARVSLQNRGPTLAFFTWLRLLREDGSEVLPTYLSDNFLTLLPEEAVELTVRAPGVVGAIPVVLEAAGRSGEAAARLKLFSVT